MASLQFALHVPPHFLATLRILPDPPSSRLPGVCDRDALSRVHLSSFTQRAIQCQYEQLAFRGDISGQLYSLLSASSRRAVRT